MQLLLDVLVSIVASCTDAACPLSILRSSHQIGPYGVSRAYVCSDRYTSNGFRYLFQNHLPPMMFLIRLRMTYTDYQCATIVSAFSNQGQAMRLIFEISLLRHQIAKSG